MGMPAAKMGDQITAVDMHMVIIPNSPPAPMPHPFNGMINGNCSTNVMIGGQAAATVGSTANNVPPHFPTPPGTGFVIPPTNQGTIIMGSATVMINGKPAARANDKAQTCADPVPNMNAVVIAAGTVLIGG